MQYYLPLAYTVSKLTPSQSKQLNIQTHICCLREVSTFCCYVKRSSTHTKMVHVKPCSPC